MQKADAKRANSPTGEARYVLAKYTYDQCVKTIERLQVQVLTDGLEPEVKREIATLKKAQAICTKYNAPEQISNALATIAAAIPGAQS